MEVSALVWQLVALQEGSAVGWMTKESSISFWKGKVFFHLRCIQTTFEASSASYSVHTQGIATGTGSKPLISV
jgi:hypothetical protein